MAVMMHGAPPGGEEGERDEAEVEGEREGERGRKRRVAENVGGTARALIGSRID